jgi:hypothetical protein
MIFSSKLKVGQSHGDEGSDNQENNEDNKQDTVNGVNPVTPNTRKYVIELNVDGTKREETCHCHLRNSTPVPREGRNFSWILRGTARSLELSLAILTSDTTQNKQG